MSILEHLQRIRAEEKQLIDNSFAGDRAEVLKIATKEFLGTADTADAEKLWQSMKVLEISETDFQELVVAVETACHTTAQAEVVQSTSKSLSQKFKEAQRNMYIAKHRTDFWQRRVYELSRLGSELSQAASRKAESRRNFPELFEPDGKIIAPLATIVKRFKAEIEKQETEAENKKLALFEEQANSLLRRFDLEPLKKGE